jgi:hypothetical protein
MGTWSDGLRADGGNAMGRFLRRGVGALVLVLVLAGCSGSSSVPAPVFGGKSVQADQRWPQELMGGDGSTVLLYQPQVESWKDQKLLRARMAVAFRRMGTDSPTLGGVLLEGDTSTSSAAGQVRISNIRIVEGRFPGLSAPDSARLLDALRARMSKEDVIVETERITAYLERAETAFTPAALKSDPPKIFVSTRPAVLVNIDGPPVLAPIPGTELSYVLNTNWDLLRAGTTYYLRHGQGWLTAPAPAGPWTAAPTIPTSFERIPASDPNWADVRKAVPGVALTPAAAPRVFVSETPAELILLDGEPKLDPIKGTRLSWATNTQSDLFRSAADQRYYYLVAGRWFRAEKLDGPWQFATTELPDDFKKIPPDHPAADVLALVPGTSQAQEAVIRGHIPQTARVERGKVEAPKVTYKGAPEWKPIAGTPLAYAGNSPFDVLKAGEVYYLCFQAVWFVAKSPEGPWELADKVPSEVYQIPPSAPVYPTTYVYVYDTNPQYVTYGYMPGYYGDYYAWGVMAFGTGWYYGSYVYDDVYWPYGYTYGAGTWYNEHTGTYGRSVVGYGPYGGAGRAAAYNPTTGTYARGAAAYGEYRAGAWAEAYNPRTGTTARAAEGSNVYGNWRTASVVRGDDWVNAARASGSAGDAAAVRTSSGGSAAVARGDNNVYVGKDGQVYRRTEGGGWQQYDGGQWSGAAASRADPGTVQGLNHDADARSTGASRASASQSWRSSGGGGGYGGGGMGGMRGGGGGGRRR